MRTNLPLAGLLIVAGVATATDLSAQETFIESFDTTAYRDSAATTADWNTADGEFRLFPYPLTLEGGLGSIGNALRCVVAGDLAFVAAGNDGLVIVDITDPGNPSPVGSYNTPGVAQNVTLSGNHAFVAGGSAGLLVIDVSDPANPSLAGTYHPGLNVADVAVDGDHAFVAIGLAGVHVVDITNPGTPTQIGATDTPGLAVRIVVSGDHAYVADSSNGLVVLDVAAPGNPVIAGSIDTPGSATDVFVDGDHAFVADGVSGLQVIDVTDPTAPALVGTVDTPGSAGGIAVDGDRAYVGDGSSGLQVIDVLDPAAPVLDAAFDTPDAAQGVVLAGDHAFVADGTSGLQVIRVRDASSIAVRGAESLPSTPHDVFVTGNLVFLADGFSGLQVVDVTDPRNPVLVGAVGTANARGVFADGDLAFVADDTFGLKVIDVTAPATPVQLGGVNTLGTAGDVFVTGNLAFVADGSSGLQVIDVGDPANPALVGSVGTPGTARGVFVDGDRAFVADDSGGLQVIDVGNPAAPTAVGSVATTSAQDVFVSGDLAFVADGASGLRVIDISDPSSPSLLGSLGTTGTATDVRVTGDHAFVGSTGSGSGLHVVDVSDPTNPTLENAATLFGGVEHVFVAGDNLFCASQNGFGLLIYHVLQGDVDVTRNVGQSTPIDASTRSIVRIRLTTVQTGSPSWAVTANGGLQWQGVSPSGSWTSLDFPGEDLRWRSTLNWSAVSDDPGASSLQIDWLHDSATITSVTDIPGDQGGQVRLEWHRSGHDFLADPEQIVEYAVYRRIDGAAAARATGFRSAASKAAQSHAQQMLAAGWDFVVTVPVRVEDEYAVVVPTLADSTITGGQHYTAFLVSALTAAPGVFFDSPADSGYSVDNLAPGIPTSLMLAAGALSWDPAPDPDFEYHSVYGSASAGLDSAATLLGYTTDESFDVSGESYAYFLVTTSDVAGNESDAAAVVGAAVAAPDPAATPRSFALSMPRPNPTRGGTTLTYDLPRAESVRIDVYDALGRRVCTVADGVRPAGRHEAFWAGTDGSGRRVSAGLYFVRLSTDDNRETRRIVLLR